MKLIALLFSTTLMMLIGCKSSSVDLINFDEISKINSINYDFGIIVLDDYIVYLKSENGKKRMLSIATLDGQTLDCLPPVQNIHGLKKKNGYTFWVYKYDSIYEINVKKPLFIKKIKLNTTYAMDEELGYEFGSIKEDDKYKVVAYSPLKDSIIWKVDGKPNSLEETSESIIGVGLSPVRNRPLRALNKKTGALLWEKMAHDLLNLKEPSSIYNIEKLFGVHQSKAYVGISKNQITEAIVVIDVTTGNVLKTLYNDEYKAYNGVHFSYSDKLIKEENIISNLNKDCYWEIDLNTYALTYFSFKDIFSSNERKIGFGASYYTKNHVWAIAGIHENPLEDPYTQLMVFDRKTKTFVYEMEKSDLWLLGYGNIHTQAIIQENYLFIPIWDKNQKQVFEIYQLSPKNS